MLAHHASGLEGFVVYRALNLPRSLSSATWTWAIGSDVPNQPATTLFYSTAMELSMLLEICRPLTREIFGHPVRMQDEQMYDQGAIQRWLAVKMTSPNTGLALESATLTPNRAMHLQIRSWVDGADLCQEPQPSPWHLRSQGRTLQIRFTSMWGAFRIPARYGRRCRSPPCMKLHSVECAARPPTSTSSWSR